MQECRESIDPHNVGLTMQIGIDKKKKKTKARTRLSKKLGLSTQNDAKFGNRTRKKKKIKLKKNSSP